MKRPPVCVREDEVEFSAIRAQGAGGQNVNKVSSAVHLRFAIRASSLPQEVKERLLALVDSVAARPKDRRPTRPARGSQRRRLEGKAARGEVKRLRGRVPGSDQG